MPSDETDRQRRLAEALRANLRRRKGQARERISEPDAHAPQGEIAPGALPPKSGA